MTEHEGQNEMRKALTDLAIGDVVSPGTELKTEDTYGSPRLFIGISVRGIPPFVK